MDKYKTYEKSQKHISYKSHLLIQNYHHVSTKYNLYTKDNFLTYVSCCFTTIKTTSLQALNSFHILDKSQTKTTL